MGFDAEVSNPGERWVTSADGELIMPDKQREYLEWLVDPERKGSQRAFSDRLGVPENRLRIWKNDYRFKLELDRRIHELNIDNFRIQRVVEAMWRSAVEDRDTKAASIYLQFVGRFMPTQRIIQDQAAASLTDMELDAELAALVSERISRADNVVDKPE